MNLISLSLMHTHNAESWYKLHHRYYASNPDRAIKAFFYDKSAKRFGQLTFAPFNEFGDGRFPRFLMCYQPRYVPGIMEIVDKCEPF